VMRELAPESGTVRDLAIYWQAVRRSSDQTRTVHHCFAARHDLFVSEESATSLCDSTNAYVQWGHLDVIAATSASDPRYDEPVKKLLESLK